MSPARSSSTSGASGRAVLPSSGSQGQEAGRRRWARLALLLVALAFVLAQFTLFDLSRGVTWDESVYLTQVTSGEQAVFLKAHRTRALALLMAPVAIFDPSVEVLRTWLIVLAGAGLFASFGTWVRTTTYAAPVGAFVFGTWWITLYWAAMVIPNYPSAIASVGAAGMLTESLRRPAPRTLAGAAAWLALGAYLRPPDAIAVGLGLGLACLLIAPRASVRNVTGLALGGLAGLAPWLIEGAIRFGTGPVGLFLRAQEVGAGGGTSSNKLPLYLQNLEARQRCVGACQEKLVAEGVWGLPPWPTVGVLVLFGAAVLVALLLDRHQGRRQAVVVGVLACASFLGVYGWISGPINVRYLLPAAGLVAIPVGVGLTVAWSGIVSVRVTTVVRVGLIVIALAILPWQLGEAQERMEPIAKRWERARVLSEVLTEAADGQPCAAAVQNNMPQIQYWSPCVTVQLHKEDNGWLQAPYGAERSHHDLRALAQDGYRIFALGRGSTPDASPVWEWDRRRLDHPLVGKYRLFTWQAGQPLPAPGESWQGDT